MYVAAMSGSSVPPDRARSEQLLRALCDVATRLIGFELDSNNVDPDYVLSVWHEVAATLAETIEILNSIESAIESEPPDAELGELCATRAAQLVRMGRLLAAAQTATEQLDAAESAQRELINTVQAVLAAHDKLP